MRLLVDTHSFLWFITGSEELSEGARQRIADTANGVFISSASLWEIAIKTSLGRLTLLRIDPKHFTAKLACLRAERTGRQRPQRDPGSADRTSDQGWKSYGPLRPGDSGSF